MIDPVEAPPWPLVRFFVRGTPRSKGSPSIYRRKGTGRPFVRESPGEIAWETSIRVLAGVQRRRAQVKPLAGPVRVELLFRLPAGGKRKRKDGQQRAAWLSPTIDIDKAARAVLDAIARELYADDRQVVELVARKRLALPEEHVGVEIAVGEAS